MNDKPTQPMTAEQILTAMYVTNDGTVSGTAAEMRQARTAVAEIIRENQALKREILGARHGGRTPQIVWDTGSDGRQQEKGNAE